uniref:Putative ribosomal pseudouridine synthase n=1 Tax=Ixodes ricinus TaxID=34613 RepID=A0A0K8R5A4_IXORI
MTPITSPGTTGSTKTTLYSMMCIWTSFGSGKNVNRISKRKLGVWESEAKADRDVDASEVVSTVSGSRGVKGSRVLKQGENSSPGEYSTTSASGAKRDTQDTDKTQPFERPELPTTQVERRQKIQRKKVSRDDQQPCSVNEQHTTESSKTASNEHHPSVSELRRDAEETGRRGVDLDSGKDAQALQRHGLYESSSVGALPPQNKTVNHPPGTRATVTKAHPLAREEALLGKLSKAQQALIGRHNKIAKDNESQSRIDTELDDAEAPSIAPHSLQKFTKRDGSEKIVIERVGDRSRAGSIAPQHLEGADDSRPPDSEEPRTAYEYLRRESPPSSVKLDSKGFLILKSEIRPDLSRLLHSEAVNLLQKRVLYNNNDILVLNKPYGMLCHGPAPEVSDACVLTKLLPDLSSALLPSSRRQAVHCVPP